MSALFQDRKHAGEELAIQLEEYLMHLENYNYNDWNSSKIKESLIVLAIPRGGVVLGNIIASKFHCNLDIVVSRKLGAPFDKEFAIGAVMPGGSYFINEHVVAMFDISDQYIQNEVEIQKKEIERRLKEFRGNTLYDRVLSGKIVILVDDGIATGATIIAASQWIKGEKNNCKKLIVAVPVAPSKDETMDKLNQIADKIIILYTPLEFSAVGQFYKRFDQITDEEVKATLNRFK